MKHHICSILPSNHDPPRFVCRNNRSAAAAVAQDLDEGWGNDVRYSSAFYPPHPLREAPGLQHILVQLVNSFLTGSPGSESEVC